MHTRTALITGASSGIGLELALCAAREGYAILAVGHDPQRLADAAERMRSHGAASVQELPADLATDGGVRQVVEAITPEISLLINDAGIGVYGALGDTEWPRQEQLLGVNVLALTRLTQAVVPHMLEAGGGDILNVGSLAGFYPGPLMATYYASKAYVVSFSHALADELRGKHIGVTVLCPGYVKDTGFVPTADLHGSNLPKSPGMLPAEVARIAWKAMLHGKRMVVPGAYNSFGVFGSRLLSWPAKAALIRRVNRKPGD